MKSCPPSYLWCAARGRAGLKLTSFSPLFPLPNFLIPDRRSATARCRAAAVSPQLVSSLDVCTYRSITSAFFITATQQSYVKTNLKEWRGFVMMILPCSWNKCHCLSVEWECGVERWEHRSAGPPLSNWDSERGAERARRTGADWGRRRDGWGGTEASESPDTTESDGDHHWRTFEH